MPRRLPGIRSLLLATYLAVLLLPVAGIGILRLYESALIRQTEAELLAQAAVLAAAYRTAWLEHAPAGALAAMPRPELQWGGPPRTARLSAGRRSCRSSISPRRRSCRVRPDAVPADASWPMPGAADRVFAHAGRQRSAAHDPGRHPHPRRTEAWSSWRPRTRMSASALPARRKWPRRCAARPRPCCANAWCRPADYSWDSISRNTALRVFVAVPVLADDRVLGAVLVSRTPRNIIQTLYSKRFALLELALVLIAAVVALAWFAGHTVVRPTRQLAAMARRVARGETHAVEPLPLPMTREAQSLSESIVTMARTLEARADYVRDLALGISHEFKTPLTGIRGGAELLRDHLDEMSAEERHKFLSNILADTERLERLVRRILELARADSLAPRGDESCDLAQATAEMAAGARRKGQLVSVTEMPAALPASIDRASFDIVLLNLLENAQQHGGKGVSVAVSGRAEAGEVIVDVCDDGVGVSSGNAARIFDRFFTTARDTGGTGLGLAIARQRVLAFGGELALVPSARGAAFQIRLKSRA